MAGTLQFRLGDLCVGELFRDVLKDDFLFESPTFGPPDYKHEKWMFTVSPKIEGSGKEQKMCLRIIVTRINGDIRIAARSAEVKIGCIYNYHTKHIIAFKKGSFTKEGVYLCNLATPTVNIYMDIGEFLDLCVVRDDDYSNNICIACDITMNVATTSPLHSCYYNVSNDFSKLFEEQEFGDMSIVCGDERFKVYKGIVCSRSAVLKTAFENDMTGTRKNACYVIKDMTPAVVKEMLYFMYTGQVPKLDEMADNLLVAAEKYEIAGLKEMCEQHMFSKLSVENATKSLIIADQNNAPYLRCEALRFIAKNGKQMKNDEDFTMLIPQYPHLFMEIYKQSF